MALGIGRTWNEYNVMVHTIVTLNSTTATLLAPDRTDSKGLSNRVAFGVVIIPSLGDVDAFIRYYAAAVDNIKQGRDVLTRHTAGNANLFHPLHRMEQDLMYHGEISGITANGSFDVAVTEVFIP